jgi:RNA polymerase sigma-70 factor (ECF subfamily)
VGTHAPTLNSFTFGPTVSTAPAPSIRSAGKVRAQGAAVVTADRAKREAFARWALPHMDQVYTTSLYLTRNREEAEDLVQDTYLRAYRFWHQFTPGTNCKAWLMTILHNSFKNRHHARYRDQQAVEFDEELYARSAAADTPPSDPETLVLSQILDEQVESALKALPLEFLEVIVLVDIQELSYEEAAAAFGCPIGTIRSRLSRGRRLLQAALQEYATEHGYTRRSACALRCP